MNDQTKQRIDIAEQREWLIEHKQAGNLSWTQIAKRIGIAHGTISSFGGDTYNGDQEKIAEKIHKYRALLSTQNQLDIEAPEVPGYFATPTSMELENLLKWAQRGRIVVAAMGAGLGKTSTGKQFQACFPNVFMVTMTPSTAGVNNMQIEVLAALACFIWSKSSREVMDGTKDAQIGDMRGMFALGADIQGEDEISAIIDRAGQVIIAGRLKVIGPVQRRHTHLEADLRRIG